MQLISREGNIFTSHVLQNGRGQDGGTGMKYTKEKALKEIQRRGIIVKKRHDRRVTQILSSATFALAFALVGTFGFFAGTDVTGTESTQYGSTLLPVEAGGYVLIAVIAFLMGVIITAIAVHVRKKKRDEAETE